MMDLLRLVLEDFMCHRFTDIDCTTFTSALIVAKSKTTSDDSNGLGKTTIYNAIHYALFGEYTTDTIDEIVRNGCIKCSVSLEFKTSQGIYKITRSRNKKSKKSDLAIWERRADKWEPISQKTPSEIDRELRKIIKISFDAFRNSILFAQTDLGGLNGLASASAEGRKIIFKEALSLLDYLKMEKIAKDKVREALETVNKVKEVITGLGDPEKDTEDLRGKLLQLTQNLSSLNEEKFVVQNESNSLREDIGKLQAILNNQDSSLINNLQEIVDNKNKLLKNLKTAQQDYEANFNYINVVKIKLEEKNKQLSDLQNDHEKLLIKQFRTVEEIQTNLIKLDQYEISGQAAIAQLKNKIQELNTPLPEGEVCGHCRQTMTIEHRQNCLIQITQDIATSTQLLEDSKNKVEKIKLKKNLLNQEIIEIQQHEKSLHRIISQINVKKMEITTTEQSEEHFKKIQDTISQKIEFLTQEIESFIIKEKHILEQIEKNDCQVATKQLQNLNLKLSDLKQKNDSLEQQINRDNTQVGMISEKINIKTLDLNKLKNLKDELKILEKSSSMRQRVAQSFGSNGIPIMIIYSILNDLQFEANNILQQIRPDIQLQIDENLEIIYTICDVPQSYKQLSGGEKLVVALALKLGLSLVIQHRIGVDIKFLELDEIDQPLDKSTLKTLVEIIKKLQNKFKIFVITHNDNLKDKFSTAILVEGDKKNGATAKVVNSW